MTITERIEGFSKLGEKIRNISSDELDALAFRAQQGNQWFTPENVKRAFEGISYICDIQKMNQWIEPYNLTSPIPKIVGLVLAGNIPLVGFHDLMCVCLTGHFAAIKTSSQDEILSRQVIEWLIAIEPRFKKNIEIRERLTSIDAVIATGSDNTARYFEYYFRNIPKIIRKNRTSVAILDGSETHNQLNELGKDIFWYFGLGCRNVSKLFVPTDYDPKTFFEGIQSYEFIGDHYKYRNNYDYHKSILLVNGTKHLDNGFLLWLPTSDLVSPISVLHVGHYENKETLDQELKAQKEKIQCVVGEGHVAFGQAQSPEPWDYADNVDTIDFLKGL